jgi:hypothetical protein
MTVRGVCRTWTQHVDPAPRDAERGIGYLDKREHVAHGCVDASDQRCKFGHLMLFVPGLPSGTCVCSATSAHPGFDIRQQTPVKWFIARWFEAALAHEGWEQAYDVRSWGLHDRLRDTLTREHRSVL